MIAMFYFITKEIVCTVQQWFYIINIMGVRDYRSFLIIC